MPADLKSIAKAAKVSVSTASRVLAGRAAEERIPADTAARVRAEAERVGYRPHQLARSLRTRRTRTLGLLVTELANPFFATIAGAVEAAASAAGYTVIVATSGEDEVRELDYLLHLHSRPTDGLIVAPAPGELVGPALRKIAEEKFPLVVIDRKLPGLECDRVLTDSRKAAAELVQALAGFGCRRVSLAGGPEGVWTAEERLAGFRKGLAAAKLPFSEESVASGPYSAEHGRAAAEAFLAGSPAPEGIVAANNKILIGVLEALTAAGESARRVAVAGFDGVPFAGFLGRAVAIAEQPESDIGTAAARMLIDRIEGKKAPPREEMLPVTVKTFPGTETLNTQHSTPNTQVLRRRRRA